MSVGNNLQEMENVVTKGAKPADPMPAGMKEEEEVEGDVVAETEVSEDEVVSEEETDLSIEKEDTAVSRSKSKKNKKNRKHKY